MANGELPKESRGKHKKFQILRVIDTFFYLKIEGGYKMEKQTRKSKPRINLTGKQFGYLTALYYIKGGKWHCKCKCGNELDVDTRNLNSGHTLSCGCLRKEKASNNVKDMSDYEDENIRVLERAGSDKKGVAMWSCLCKHCGNIFITRGKSIRDNQVNSCGCIHSINEQKIIQLLKENNIEFATQYTFPDLKGIHNGKLRFDFAIFNQLHELSHLIEYNGEQHYNQPQGKWSKSFTITQQHDKLKKEYCKKHNIRLIIIPYNLNYSIKDLL